MTTVREQSLFSRHFHSELDRLRARIDELPEDQRPHLIQMADQMEAQHDAMQASCQQIHTAASDLGRVAHKMKSALAAEPPGEPDA